MDQNDDAKGPELQKSAFIKDQTALEKLKIRLEYMLKRTTAEAVLDFQGFNHSDQIFFKDLVLDEDILPEANFKLKKYKKQLELGGLWDKDLEAQEKPEEKVKKERRIEGAVLIKKGEKIEIHHMTGKIFSAIAALKSIGGYAKKIDGEWVWYVLERRLLSQKERFSRLGLNLDQITESEEPVEEDEELFFDAPHLNGLKIEVRKDLFFCSFPFHRDLIQAFKSVGSFKYIKKTHERSIQRTAAGAERLKKIIHTAKDLNLSVEGEEALREIDRLLEEKKELLNKKAELLKNEELEVKGLEKLKIKPYPYQQAGILFLNYAQGNAILGDEMGLGKTLQALSWCALNDKKALVVCPKSFVYGWKAEVEKFSKKTTQVLSPKSEAFEQADFTILNYDILSKFDFKKLKFDCLIIDESHMIKNTSTKRYKEIKKIAKLAKHKILLSGTPITNRPVEFFSQLGLVAPGLTGDYFSFTKKFCGGYDNGFGWDASGATNLNELVELIAPVYLRRNKADVLKELPEKIRQEILIQGLKIKPDPAAENALTEINRIKMELALLKVPATIEFIKNILEQGEKVVVFSDYVEPTKQIFEAFKDKAILYHRDLDPEERKELQDRFQNDPSIKVFVATMRLASVALTLTAASHCVQNDMPFEPGTLLQSEDRLHRMGQKKTVNIYRMVAENTLDDQITKLLTKKAEVLRAVLDNRADQYSMDEKKSAEESILTDLRKLFKVKEV